MFLHIIDLKDALTYIKYAGYLHEDWDFTFILSSSSHISYTDIDTLACIAYSDVRFDRSIYIYWYVLFKIGPTTCHFALNL